MELSITSNFEKPIIFEKKKKKYRRNRLKVNPPRLFNPPKFLQPLKYLRIMGDIPLTDSLSMMDSTEQHFILTQYFQEFKKVSSVIYDKKNETICAKVESVSSFFPPTDLIIDRLISLSDVSAYKLAQTIKKYSKLISYCRPPFEISNTPPLKNNEYQKFISRFQERSDKLRSQPFVNFRLNFSKNSKNLEIFQIDFNAKLSELLGDSVEELSLKTLKVCIPPFVLLDMNYYEFFNRFLHNSTVSKIMGEPELPLYSKVVIQKDKTEKKHMKIQSDYFYSPTYTEIILSVAFDYETQIPVKKKSHLYLSNENQKDRLNLKHLGSNEKEFVKEFYPDLIPKSVAGYKTIE